jgi:hypothetical protein
MSPNPRLPRLGLILILAITSASSVAALTAHAPFAPFSVTIESGSTVFNNAINFNGSRADLIGPFGVSGTPNGGQVNVSGTVIATFQADPGFAFSAANLHFGQWSYSNAPFYSGHGHYGSWSIPGSTYVGDLNPADVGPTSDSWTGSGSSGGFSYYRYVWWDGGGHPSYKSIMGPFGTLPVQLGLVSSFTVTLNNTIFAVNDSGYGVSSFNVQTEIVGAPTPPPAVPDSAVPPALLGLVTVGLATVGQRLRRRG